MAAFDISQKLVGGSVGRVPIRHLDDLPDFVRQADVRLAVVAVPPPAAQGVCNLLCEAGIQGILNFAPVSVYAPHGVTVRQVDLAAQLEQLSFHVGAVAQ